jgi:hypothetical protein
MISSLRLGCFSLVFSFVFGISNASAVQKGKFEIKNLFVDGKGHGLVQIEGPRDSGIYSWDWLWFDGNTIHVLESLGSSGEAYSFKDPRFAKIIQAEGSDQTYPDPSVDMKLQRASADWNSPLISIEYTCAKQDQSGKDFRFEPASESEKATLQAKLNVGTVKVAYPPEVRRLSWVLRDSRGTYFVLDTKEMGPPTSEIENIFVGSKNSLKKVEAAHVMAMCGVDHRITFKNGSLLAIFRPEAAEGCQNQAPIQATLSAKGSSRKKKLEVLDAEKIAPTSLGLDPALYRTDEVVLRTPCDLAVE